MIYIHVYEYEIFIYYLIQDMSDSHFRFRHGDNYRHSRKHEVSPIVLI